MEYTMSYRGVDWEKVPDDVRQALNDVVEKTAFEIQRLAQYFIRLHDLIDTGNLLNSITVFFSEENSRTSALIVVQAEYGIYHELGTVYLPARPFLYPAVVEEQVFFNEAIRQVLQRIS